MCALIDLPVFAINEVAVRERFSRKDTDFISGVEAGLLSELAHQLDTVGDSVAAAQSVRALMFVHRFLLDVDRRVEALEL